MTRLLTVPSGVDSSNSIPSTTASMHSRVSSGWTMYCPPSRIITGSSGSEEVMRTSNCPSRGARPMLHRSNVTETDSPGSTEPFAPSSW